MGHPFTEENIFPCLSFFLFLGDSEDEGREAHEERSARKAGRRKKGERWVSESGREKETEEEKNREEREAF